MFSLAERVRQAREAVPSGWLRALVLPLIVLAWLAVLVLVVSVLGHFTRTILLVALAAVLAFAFAPLAHFFERWAPRGAAIGLAYVVGLGVVLGFGAYVVATAASQISSLVTNLPKDAQQLQSLQPRVDAVLGPLGVGSTSIADLENQLLGELQTAASTIAREGLARIAALFGTVVDLVLVVILSVYFEADGARIAQWLKNETPDTTRSRAHLLVAVVNRVIGGYIRGVLTLALLIGVMVGVGLAILGVPYAVLLGVLAFFMEFIPVLGVFISGAASIGLAIVHFQDLLHPLLVLGYFIFVHVIEGDVIGPRIMSRAVGIHPATSLIALVAGTEVFGIWGALFAAPVAGLLQAVATAAWLEFRGGQPDEVINAIADTTTERAQDSAQAVARQS